MKISSKREYNYKLADYSSQFDGVSAAENLLKITGYWSSARREAPEIEYVVLELDEIEFIDTIEIEPSPNGAMTFPLSFRIEAGIDAETWEIIHTEKNLELDTSSFRLDLPLVRMKFLKIIITEMRPVNSAYYSEIGKISAGIAGIREIKASSSHAKNGPELLFDDTISTFWESEKKSSPEMESLNIDLGKITPIHRIITASSQSGFPENFKIEISIDNSIWTELMEARNFIAEKNIRYNWNFDVFNARYLKISARAVKSNDGNFCIRMAILEIYSSLSSRTHTHNCGNMVPHSSIFQAGIVKLAKDGDISAATAVQSSDSRLKDSTTIFRGIVQLADDGQDKPGAAVQASDSRLKPATELKPGIVRLGYDREIKSGVSVQCNDSRLQHATVDSFGIVKLCPDMVESENGVVVGNDSRLKKASVTSYGICRLSKNGDTGTDSVVLANDRRLRDATEDYKGIVELAGDGEDSPEVAVQGNDRRLKNATTLSRGVVELAEDGEESPEVAVQGNDRRLRDSTTESKGIVELAENREVKPGAAVQSNDDRLKDATTATCGTVMLANDGEELIGKAVQGNDRRLRNATETSMGIMRFGLDGEENPLTAVQGNDRRIKKASTLSMGIVELAEDGEEARGVVVQGNDRRLKEATAESVGIVRLAKDGEDRPGVVIQGNDRRLREATTSIKGILRFAEDSDTSSLCAVQGSDSRLKEATTTSKGIVEFAENGEERSGVAVQGDDKRLREATTLSKGIVELAGDGESISGVAVQGNDRRLMAASEDNPGIVRFAKDGDGRSGLAVQAGDKRLRDAREPLPHNHEYAHVDHDFNSHTGTISIKADKREIFNGITPPSDNSAVILGFNSAGGDGSIGIAGIAGILSREPVQSYGLVGHSSHVGVRGQSTGGENLYGCGVLGISRFGAGGVFSSEHNYSLVVDGYGDTEKFDKNINLIGNGDALFVKGKSEFIGQMILKKPADGTDYPANIVEYFEIDDVEYVSPGDLLVVSSQGKSMLSKARNPYSRGVIGVVSGNPAFIINNSGKEVKVYPVCLAGKALCRIDARKKPVNPGDLIMTSDTPGCGFAGKIDSFDKIGTVAGKALGMLDGSIDLVPIFIALQ